jgi:hypothetical protein
MPRGASSKREREYEHLKDTFEKEGRYKGRQKQVAARIVNKQRAQYGETRKEKQKDRQGKSPDRGLPIENYQHLTIPEAARKLDKLSASELKRVMTYEQKHKNRKGLVRQIERKLHR